MSNITATYTMSVYDFDNQSQGADNSVEINQQLSLATNRDGVSGSVTNGVHPLTRYNQAESNFLNRNLSNVNHSSDTSVSMTRPTSKTALLVRQRRAMLEQLSCFICKGYLIDATTIDECMDSFCKSCIVLHLRSHNNCPKCGVLIHKTNPLGSIRSDKVLQDIVYKLVPGLYDDEMRRRREFYKKLFGTAPSSSEEDEDSSSSEDLPDPTMRSEKYGSVSHPKPFYKPTDFIDISIEPQLRNDCTTIYYDNRRQSIITCFTGNLMQRQVSTSFSTVDSHHFKTYLRCPAKLTVAQLKKFIAAKFNVCREDTMHLLYLNESLRDEYSLIDVAYIYDWRGIEHMRMFYIIERDLSKMAMNSTESHNQNEHASIPPGKTTRQSIGTSTQPTKRVCIDPQPTFYEEERNNNTITNSTGRSMRPRPTESATAKTTTSQTSQAPILRSSTSTNESGNQTVRLRSGSHEISNRELVALNTGHNARQQPAAYRSYIQAAAADELSRMRNDGRTPRRLPNTSSEQVSTKSILKINMADRSASSDKSRNEDRQVGSYTQSHSTSDRDKILTVGNSQQSQHPHQQYQIYHQQPHSQQQNDQKSQPTHQQQAQQNNQFQPNQPSNVRQLIPFVGSRYASTTTCMASPSKSSLVTLASFTEGNHVMATLSSTSATATTISNSYRNMLGTQTLAKDIGRTTWTNQIASTTAPSQPSSTSSTATTTSKNSTQSTPQLAFSIVTERGFIVRRLNSQPSNNTQLNNVTVRAPTSTAQRTISIPSLPAPPSSNSNQSRQQDQQQHISSQPSQKHSSSTSPIHFQPSNPTGTNQYNMAGGSVRSSSNHNHNMSQSSSTGTHQSSNIDFNRSRHHIKVKPVYKTLVDPTKVKSPNFKKNHTARH